jgi:hypothetical protein
VRAPNRLELVREISCIQQVAHELQHAIEVAGVPQVVDADSLRALDSRIGSAEMAPDTFETIAALAVAAPSGPRSNSGAVDPREVQAA